MPDSQTPAPDRIGKYEIVEQIGRGGMGTIFRAHDPVLNRPVALKMISTEMEITEEMRARFFREAQACARLSHPNIVTVYDMGEDDGRLFIVMELLEGVELRRLIADRARLALEEKLAIIMQVCDGLHYAHQRGIVHRDIKPSNILRVGNGQVKILDFGIARIENFQQTLTRTGLIMGTLRYMAPEQVRGRADHRADIFSVGAVLYELLSWRPPFGARDALRLLEQLRTEDPPPLHHLDPTIPPELSDLVAQAMRKDPATRFPDLAQMRVGVDHAQRRLAEEARHVKERLRGHRDRLGRLRTAISSRIGASNEDATVMVAEPRHLGDLQALEADLLGQIEAAKGTLKQADALMPAFERGLELLEDGQLTDAIAELEGVVATLPAHALAADALARARAQADAERLRGLAARLVEDARAALEAGEYPVCLDLLKQAAEIPPPAEVIQDIVSLRDKAELRAAAVPPCPPAGDAEAPAREEARPSPPDSVGRRVEAGVTRPFAGAGTTIGAARTEGLPAADQAAPGLAPEPLVRGTAVQGRAGEITPEVTGTSEPAREDRSQAEESRGLDGPSRDRLMQVPQEGAGAIEDTSPGRDTRGRWIRIGSIAAGLAGLAVIALVLSYSRSPRVEPRVPAPPQVATSPAPPQAATSPAPPQVATSPAPPQVATSPAPPQVATSPAPPQAATSPAPPDLSAPSVPSAVSGGTGVSGDRGERPGPPQEAGTSVERSSRPRAGESAVARPEPEGSALPPRRRAEERGAGLPATGSRQAAEQAEAQVAGARRAAEKAAATFFAPKLFEAAQAKERDGAEALRRSDYNTAARLLADARADYQAAAQQARTEADSERQIAPVKAGVEQARDRALSRRRQALAADAERLAMDLLRAAELKHAEADRLATRQSFQAAERAYSEAADRYADAAHRAQTAASPR
jgi:hypothetical protein